MKRERKRSAKKRNETKHSHLKCIQHSSFTVLEPIIQNYIRIKSLSLLNDKGTIHIHYIINDQRIHEHKADQPSKKTNEKNEEENVKENKGITDPLSDGRHYLNTL